MNRKPIHQKLELCWGLTEQSWTTRLWYKLCVKLVKVQTRRLAPAYFSPNYKYFGLVLQTVKNKTTVLNLVFNEFLQKSIPPLISVLYAKGYHVFPLKNFCLTVPKKIRRGTLLCFRKFGVSKNFMPKTGISRFSTENLLSHSTEKLRRGTL